MWKNTQINIHNRRLLLINLYHSGSVSEPIQPTKIGKNIFKNHEKQIAFNEHKYFTTPQN